MDILTLALCPVRWPNLNPRAREKGTFRRMEGWMDHEL